MLLTRWAEGTSCHKYDFVCQVAEFSPWIKRDHLVKCFLGVDERVNVLKVLNTDS